jgi:hypothetical protein
MDRLFLGLICVGAALLIVAAINMAPVTTKDGSSSKPVLRLIDR